MSYSKTLLKQNRSLFHTSDLALLWGIDNKNTLYTTIKRYVKKGVLIRIHKGFYSTKPLNSIDPVLLGIGYLHDYAYLSTESILNISGVINQTSRTITLVSSKSRIFNIYGIEYISRAMKPEYLYNDIGIVEHPNGYRMATPERAAADLLYYSPKYHFDNPKRLKMDEVNKIKREIDY